MLLKPMTGPSQISISNEHFFYHHTRNRQKCQAARACVPQPDANIPGRALRVRGIGYRLGATERTVSVSPSTEKRTSQPPKAMP